jgi:hypothetical protein
VTPGAGLIRLDLVGTAAFVVTAVVEAIVLDWARPPGVAVALVLFATGCVLFLAGYARAVERSRTEEVSVAGLYLLSGDVAPPRAKRVLLGLLAVQVVVALATAIARPYTTVAFGILVPMFGIGVIGSWAARHGTFPPRQTLAPKRRRAAKGGHMP